MDFLPIRKLYHCNENFPYPEASIQEAVKRFGKLPNMLIKFYQQLGANQEINQAQTYPCSPANLTLENGYLTFYVEDQESMWWAIKQEDLGEDNPAVYACVWKNGEYVYLPESDTLEHFYVPWHIVRQWKSCPGTVKGLFLVTLRENPE